MTRTERAFLVRIIALEDLGDPEIRNWYRSSLLAGWLLPVRRTTPCLAIIHPPECIAARFAQRGTRGHCSFTTLIPNAERPEDDSCARRAGMWPDERDACQQPTTDRRLGYRKRDANTGYHHLFTGAPRRRRSDADCREAQPLNQHPAANVAGHSAGASVCDLLGALLHRVRDGVYKRRRGANATVAKPQSDILNPPES